MDGKDLYISIYNYLLTKIHFGFYPEGECLPSILNLSKLFGVSTMAVREAIRLLRKDGYLSEGSGQAVIRFDPENPPREFPSHILAQGDSLKDIHQSFDLIFPSVFFSGLSVCGEPELDELSQILKRPIFSWDEPMLDFLSHIVTYLKNPLLVNLHYDVMFYCYPTYLAYVAADRERWKDTYGSLLAKLENIISLKRSGNDRELWNILKQTYPRFAPQSESGRQPERTPSYQWGKPQICLTTASAIVSRIYDGVYPVGTFLPSARLLAEEFSMSIITLRRSIILLNDLGIAESINGRGTKVISPEQGLRKVKWDSPVFKKSIMLYLESLHILTITCRLLAVSVFPLFSREERDRLKEKIKSIHPQKYVGLANALCLKALVNASGLTSLKVIYDKLFSYMIWGQPLSYLEPYLRLDQYQELLVSSLDSGDVDRFACALEQAFAASFVSSKRKAISVGVQEAETLSLPYPEPDILNL